MQAGVFCFSLAAAAFWFQPVCAAVEGRSNVVRNTHVQLQISLPTRFLSLLHWASQSAFGDGIYVGCSFDSFSVFLLSLKQQQNLVKIMFSCIHFPIWPYPPKIMKKLYFIPVNCMGWQVCRTEKLYCLQARPCIFQPGNFAGWGSERVKMPPWFSLLTYNGSGCMQWQLVSCLACAACTTIWISGTKVVRLYITLAQRPKGAWKGQLWHWMMFFLHRVLRTKGSF